MTDGKCITLTTDEQPASVLIRLHTDLTIMFWRFIETTRSLRLKTDEDDDLDLDRNPEILL